MTENETPVRIGVTGASGKVGSLVAELLASSAADREVRLIVRTPSRAPRLVEAPGVSVTIHEATYGDTEACRAAFAGLDVLFLVSAGESLDRMTEHRSVIDAARAAGVRHVVYTSFLGAAPDATFTLARDHYATEQLLRDSGMQWTFLRDALYSDVLLDFAGPERIIRGPAGDGRCAFVARHDVAHVAAAVLGDPSDFEQRTLDLTGPEALTMGEVVMRLTDALGRSYEFEDETLEEARESRAGYGAEDWQVEAWISTYTAIASGELSAVSDDVRAVLGRAPMSVGQTVRAIVAAEGPEQWV